LLRDVILPGSETRWRFQVAQSLFAQADGGLFGAGLGESLMQLPNASGGCIDDFPDCGSIVPAPHTDLIYAVITNELGLFGSVNPRITCPDGSYHRVPYDQLESDETTCVG
jgi:hypothetical protein